MTAVYLNRVKISHILLDLAFIGDTIRTGLYCFFRLCFRKDCHCTYRLITYEYMRLGPTYIYVSYLLWEM